MDSIAIIQKLIGNGSITAAEAVVLLQDIAKVTSIPTVSTPEYDPHFFVDMSKVY